MSLNTQIFTEHTEARIWHKVSTGGNFGSPSEAPPTSVGTAREVLG